LDRKLPVDVSGAGGRTPLMSAVLSGSPAMVRYLLSQKADPLKKDAEGFNPLMLAVRAGRAEMVAELAPYDREKLDDALLVAALEGKAAVIDELTNYGASVYARMDDGRTPLMLAAENGHVEAVEMLIEIGANRFSMDDEGRIAADVDMAIDRLRGIGKHHRPRRRTKAIVSPRAAATAARNCSSAWRDMENSFPIGDREKSRRRETSPAKEKSPNRQRAVRAMDRCRAALRQADGMMASPGSPGQHAETLQQLHQQLRCMGRKRCSHDRGKTIVGCKSLP
jgi:hypothetical protein